MKKISLIVILVALLTSACARDLKREENVVKVVGKEKISQEEIRREMEELPEEYKAYYSGEDGEKKILEELIVQKILKQEALKEGVDKNEEYRSQLDRMKERLLVSFLVKEKILDRVSVSEDEMKEYYEEHSSEYVFPESVMASHILIRTSEEMTEEEKDNAKKRAMEILEKATPQNFNELAKQSSEGPSAKNGGKLGWFTMDQMIPEFSKAAFSGKKGEIYPEIVETVFGFHIIYIEDKQEEEELSFEDVKGEIEQNLLSNKKVSEYNSWVEELKSKYLQD